MLRALADQQPQLSFPTDAELETIETGTLRSGDRVFSEESGSYIYLKNATIAPTAGVIATLNSQGGTYPGRFIFDGFGPAGPVGTSVFSEDVRETNIVFTAADPDSLLIASVAVDTTVPNQAVLLLFTYSGSNTDDVANTRSTFNVRFFVDTADQSHGAAETTETTGDFATGAVHRIFTFATPGTHTFEIFGDVVGGRFAINAGTASDSNHAILTAVSLGVGP
jgi:hypothetical protein